jgi:nitroreductase
MDFLSLAKQRFSSRSYSNKEVEQEKIDRILEAGRVAPTACNNQPQRILVIRTKEGLEKLQHAYHTFNAPLAFIVCADHSASWKRSSDGKDSADIDTSIVTTHMMLEATDLGLDSVWICAFKPDIIRKEFSLPDSVEPVNLLLVGYADGPRKSPDRFKTERLPLSKTVFYESF